MRKARGDWRDHLSNKTTRIIVQRTRHHDLTATGKRHVNGPSPGRINSFDRLGQVVGRVATMHAWLASAYALNGESQRAAAELAEARKLRGGGYSSIARMKSPEQDVVPKVRALFDATYFAGLRKAGVPEE